MILVYVRDANTVRSKTFFGAFLMASHTNVLPRIELCDWVIFRISYKIIFWVLDAGAFSLRVGTFKLIYL